MKYLIIATTLAALAAASPINPATPAEPTLAPLVERAGADNIEDAYIVVFKQGTSLEQVSLHLGFVNQWYASDPLLSVSATGDADDGGVKHIYTPTSSGHGYYGYAGSFTPDTLSNIRSAPEIDYVERDQIMYTQDMPQGVDNWWTSAVPETADAFKPSDDDKEIVTERGAPWGLARISHRESLHFSTFNRYDYDRHGGDGVTAYVIDTGVNIEHVEFEGRARWGKTIPKNDVDKDANGHGTHCAGTIGSRKYGVAKAAEIVAVKVLGSSGQGTMSDVVAGVVWAAEHASAAAADAAKELAATGKTKHKGSVANMSLGGGKAKSLDEAVNAAVEAGLHFAVAAGNDNKDACNYSPAAAEGAVTVGASALTDARAYFSNHGKCVDVFAPGLQILSTWNSGNQSENTISGTSMASPHICGLLAYLLSIEGSETFNALNLDLGEDNVAAIVQDSSYYAQAWSLLPRLAQAVLPAPAAEMAPIPPKHSMTPKQLKKALIALASPGLLTDLPAGTPNLLAFNNATLAQKKNA